MKVSEQVLGDILSFHKIARHKHMKDLVMHLFVLFSTKVGSCGFDFLDFILA